MKRLVTLCLLLFFHANALFAQSKKTTILSPDKKISFSLSLDQGRLFYQVFFDNKPVINTSKLGLTVDSQFVGMGSDIGSIQKSIIHETYPWRGVHSKALNYCRDARIHITGTGPYPSFELEVRVFNDGIAFRYLLHIDGKSVVNDDNTEFSIPQGSVIWSQGDINYYEGSYRQQHIATVQKGQKAGPPLTIQLPGGLGYAAVTEGGLIDFAGMSLLAEGDGKFKARLAGVTHTDGEIRSPWRIIEIGADLNTLVNCDIIHNVSPAMDKTLFPEGYNTSWLKPGKATWSWLAENGGVTFENMKRFSRWAGQLGFAYNLVDEGWYRWHDGDKDQWALLKELVRYADSQHVKIWVWKAYPDRKGIPGLESAAARISFFKKCKEAGVAGIKIDFFDSERQQVIDFYQAALKDAARFYLMLDFHGADKPTGQVRTWPNEMSREAVKGLEGGVDIRYNTIAPFARLLAGHADYTPLTFRSAGTTWAYQVASMAVYASAFMCLAVNPEELLRNPCKEMVQSIPVTWDETVVLPQSKIGKLVLYARRKGSTWFLAAMNNDTARGIKVKLSFLGRGKYETTLLRDRQNKNDTVAISSEELKRKNTLTIHMNAGGGFVGRFIKK